MAEQPLFEATALEQAVTEINEWLEYELLGAWRSGFNYLHYYTSSDLSTADLQAAAFPSYSETPPNPRGYDYVETYVLEDVTRQAIEEVSDCDN